MKNNEELIQGHVQSEQQENEQKPIIQMQTEYRFKIIDQKDEITEDIVNIIKNVLEKNLSGNETTPIETRTTKIDDENKNAQEEMMTHKGDETDERAEDEFYEDHETDMEGEEEQSDVTDRREMKRLIRRLALYPYVLERPICEADILGERLSFQIVSKRGNWIRIYYDRQFEWVEIDDIENFTVIS